MCIEQGELALRKEVANTCESPLAIVTPALYNTTAEAKLAFQNNGIIGCNVWRPHPLERARQPVFVGIHREPGEQNANVCLLLDYICALQSPPELNSQLLLIRVKERQE